MASPLAAGHRERLSTRDRVWPDTLRAYQVAWRQWFRPDSTGSDAGKAAPLRAPSGGSDSSRARSCRPNASVPCGQEEGCPRRWNVGPWPPTTFAQAETWPTAAGEGGTGRARDPARERLRAVHTPSPPQRHPVVRKRRWVWPRAPPLKASPRPWRWPFSALPSAPPPAPRWPPAAATRTWDAIQ